MNLGFDAEHSKFVRERLWSESAVPGASFWETIWETAFFMKNNKKSLKKSVTWDFVHKLKMSILDDSEDMVVRGS